MPPEEKEWEKQLSNQCYFFGDIAPLKIFIRQVEASAYQRGREEALASVGSDKWFSIGYLHGQESMKAAAIRVVPKERGSEEQEKASLCGLYHWDDCRKAVLEALTALPVTDISEAATTKEAAETGRRPHNMVDYQHLAEEGPK